MALADILINGVKVGKVSGTPTIVGLRSAKGEAGALRIDDQTEVRLIIEDVANKQVATLAAVPHELSSATVENAAASDLVLTYDSDLDEDSVPAVGDFDVQVDGSANVVTAVDVTGSVVTLTLTDAIVNGEVVTVGYTPGDDPIQNEDGDVQAGHLYFTHVTNNVV